MVNHEQKELDTYFKKTKLLLPIYSKQEKQFLKDFKDSVSVFIEKNPLCTMEDVIERFSEPEEVVHDYIAEAAVGKLYVDGVVVQTVPKTVTLTCSPTGKFSCFT